MFCSKISKCFSQTLSQLILSTSIMRHFLDEEMDIQRRPNKLSQWVLVFGPDLQLPALVTQHNTDLGVPGSDEPTLIYKTPKQTLDGLQRVTCKAIKSNTSPL